MDHSQDRDYYLSLAQPQFYEYNEDDGFSPPNEKKKTGFEEFA